MSSNPQASTEGRQSPSAEKQTDKQIGQQSSGKSQQHTQKQDVKGDEEQKKGLESNPAGPLDKEAERKLR